MVIVMLMMIFLAMMSIALWAYSRTLLTSAAAQAVRYAANADVSVAAATARTSDIMSHTIAGSTADTVSCEPVAVTGPLIGLQCSMYAPGLLSLLDGALPTINVTVHSLNEHR